MKKTTLILFILLVLGGRCFCQPQIITPTFPASVNLFDLFEISFTTGNCYSNPYDPHIISIYALFIAPDNSTYKVNAFYFEDYSFQKAFYGNDYYEVVSSSLQNVGWRVRFTPTQIGNWRFRIIAEDSNGLSSMPNTGIRNYSFSCTSVSNANGFITMANTRFLKRDVVKSGVRNFQSYFPIGPNVAWYDCLDYCDFQMPQGVYYYEDHIDSLYGKANFMRIWINRYHYLSLYGPEFTQTENGNPKVYFDSIVNQKDAAELDRIISYALQHDISVMLSIFNQNDFKTSSGGCNQCIWENNPFHTIIGLSSPSDFFTDVEAIKITKNLIRYIVSRWGYATNVLCWELWNEVDHVAQICQGDAQIYLKISTWHNKMAKYIKEIDPYQHCISSSVSGIDNNLGYSTLFTNLDINQQHNSNNNTITLPITNQPVGSRYIVTWYNSETGNPYNGVSFSSVQMDSQGNEYVSFRFPSFIRNLQNQTISNTFGDAVFVLHLFNNLNKSDNSKKKHKNNT